MGAGLAAIALVIGHVAVPVVMALAVVAGLGYPALTGAWSAQLPKLIPAGRITHAYAADAATYSVAAVAAPPIATALVAVSATAPLWLAVALLLAMLPLATSALARAMDCADSRTWPTSRRSDSCIAQAGSAAVVPPGQALTDATPTDPDGDDAPDLLLAMDSSHYAALRRIPADRRTAGLTPTARNAW